MKSKEIIAILASDIHLQNRAPVARAAEPCWFTAMARPLAELGKLALEHKVPVFYAGDIFDRWNANAELINFALQHLPKGYAIPGQHDLPNHNYRDMGRTGYGTLRAVGIIEDLRPGRVYEIGDDLAVRAFPWGHPLQPTTPTPGRINLAVIHAFVYNSRKNGYQGADASSRASVAKKALEGHDVAVFGDNHKGFTDTTAGPVVFNCGGFMRRKIDEGAYRPAVGLLFSDGTVKRHYLDTAEEEFAVYTEAEKAVDTVLDVSALVDELNGLGESDSLDFNAALRAFLNTNKVKKEVADVVLAAATE